MRKSLMLLLFPLILFGQKKEVVYKKLADLACECTSKKDLDKMTESDLGVCIFEALEQLTVKEKKTIGYNPDRKSETLVGIAENVGLEMALLCPKVFVKFEKEETTFEEPPKVEQILSSYRGSFEVMTSGDFNTITIIDESNTKREFLWLFSFSGDSLFIKDKIVKGDKIEVFYVEQEFFDPKTKMYRIYNEITQVKLL